jgi:hypothetical protein
MGIVYKAEGLTLDQFIFTMRSGTDLKNLPPVPPGPVLDLLQIMPWPQYQNLTVNDLRAIYEYLKGDCLCAGRSGPFSHALHPLSYAPSWLRFDHAE